MEEIKKHSGTKSSRILNKKLTGKQKVEVVKEERKNGKKGLDVNYKGVLVPLGVSAIGVIVYFAGNYISTVLQENGGEDPSVGLTVADLGRVIGLWGLIIAFAGFLVVFLASGLIYSMKTIESGEPTKQEPTDIAGKYNQIKEMEDPTDITSEFRKMKEMENLIDEIDEGGE